METELLKVCQMSMVFLTSIETEVLIYGRMNTGQIIEPRFVSKYQKKTTCMKEKKFSMKVVANTRWKALLISIMTDMLTDIILMHQKDKITTI